MFEELDDEITSINSIYGDNTLRVLSGKTRVLALTVPAQPAVTLRVEFSPEYPDVPPSILGTQSVSDDASKGDGAYLAELVRSVLSEVYTPGSPCIFDLVEEVGSRLEELSSHQVSRSDKESGVVADDQQTSSSIDEPLRSNNEQQFHPVHDAAPWLLSEVITEKKSVFVARCAPVDSVDQAKRYLAHLLSTDKKVAKATHSKSSNLLHSHLYTKNFQCNQRSINSRSYYRHHRMADPRLERRAIPRLRR